MKFLTIDGIEEKLEQLVNLLKRVLTSVDFFVHQD